MATPAPNTAQPLPDPNTPVTPPQTPSRVQAQAQDLKMSGEMMQEQIKNEAIKGGAPAFKFDPSDSPAEKAAEARKAIPPGLKLQPSTKGAAVIDPDVSTPVNNVATNPQTPAEAYVNGHPKAGDGEWGRTGWAPRFGSGLAENPGGFGVPLEALDIDRTTWLEKRLDDKFFGGKFPIPHDMHRFHPN
ncbi:hypothetical protein H072_11609 [Dactylellina haptotyla CBS 200.50]|uniref:Uncharacterized protein n=1 Tax=Dactylellina haptotyla (strain CBS 200.50) TaxID=1284197 RepID=S7ZWM3_DACHA|nr:hypothetical protein H072_11609 [Dactylellina haptotyla CBS 200.50]